MNWGDFIGMGRIAPGMSLFHAFEADGRKFQPAHDSYALIRVRGVMARQSTDVRQYLTFQDKWQIILTLANKGEFGVQDAAEELDGSNGLTSEFLAQAVERGLLMRTKDGRHARFRLPE